MPAKFSKTHLVIVPSYNTGSILIKTVRGILEYWQPLWVVIDGSDDGSDALLTPLESEFSDALKVFRLPKNCGKGAAVLYGVQIAQEQGYTHVLTMDADYQHPADYIQAYMATSSRAPDAMILGEPVFDASAPSIRVKGRKISNSLIHLETLGWGVNDALFGMRLYPVRELLQVMESTHWARRFDFETEVVVQLAWLGVPAINMPTPVRYLSKQEGGISQFRYVRDNTLLTWMHMRLLLGFILRLPKLIARTLS